MSAAQSVQPPSASLRDAPPPQAGRGEAPSPALQESDWVRVARLCAHIEKRLMSRDWLLAQAHGRAAAWYGGADRLALLAVQVAAMDKVHELSITLLKGRIWVLREWRAALADGDSALVVGLIEDCLSGEIPCLPVAMMPYAAVDRAALRQAEVDEANLALGAWDGPEEILKLMDGGRNVAS
jgi:hypothetical protein